MPILKPNLKIKDIVSNILTNDEIETAKTMFKDWQKTIENHDKIHRSIDPHEFINITRLGISVMLAYPNKSKFEIFETIWNCDELIASHDGSCYTDKNNKQKDKIWTHTDQGPENQTRCYQGFVALTSNKERTLIV